MEQVVLVLFLALALSSVSLAAVHDVGDTAGWTTIGNVNYSKWASTRAFYVGDSLVFQYNNQFHNVKQVSHQDFQTCNATSAVAVYSSGSDSVTLKRNGHYYFLCGQAGQKLDVLVKRGSTIQGPSPAPLGSPSLGSPSTTVAPGPAQNAGSQIRCSGFWLMVSMMVAWVTGFTV